MKTPAYFTFLRPGRRILLCAHSLKYLFVLAILFSATAFAQPVITSFTPSSGPVGTSVTITGSNFSAVPANNIVYFGAVRATVSAAATTSLTVSVPAGATYQPVSVTVNNLTGYSGKPFIVTFPGGITITQNLDQTQNSFEPEIFATTDLHPNGVAIADFDGDGKPDLATANNYSMIGAPASVSVLRNTGSSGAISFAEKQDISTGTLTYAIAAGDLNGDGQPDMVSTSITDKKMSVFKNTSVSGTISFAAKTDYTTGDSPYSIAIADMDGDGKPDIIIANYFSNSISIFRNTSAGGTLSFAAKIDFATAGTPQCVAAGDLDGDGKSDLAVVNELFNSVSIFRNTGSSGSITLAARQDLTTAGSPYGVAIGDINLDGKSDLVVANNGANSFSVFRNTSAAPGSVSFAAKLDFGLRSGPYSASISDLNGDGKPDIVIATSDLAVVQNNSTTSAISLGGATYLNPLLTPFVVAIGDLDGDGKSDLAGGAFSAERVMLIRNKSNEPTIKTFAPASGVAGTTVTIDGSNFSGVTAVGFGGVPAASFTIVNATKITAVVGAGASGSVSATNQYGTNRKEGFTFHAPPTITSFTPVSAATGTVITITGTFLSTATSVKFGGVAAQSFTIVSPTTITAKIGSGASGDVSVTTPYGTATLAGFTYQPPPPPAITSFTPANGGMGMTIAITGTRFTGATAVSFGGVPAQSFTVVSATTINAKVAAGASGNISVTTPDGTATISGFTYIPAPVVSSFTPTGFTGSTVTVTGTNFIGVTAVRFGGIAAASFTIVSPTTITAVLANGGTGDVTVVTPYGTGTLAGFVFMYPPNVFNYNPPAGGLGQTITITGTNFTDATQVRFGGVAAQSFTVVSPTTITAVLGTGASGVVSVTTPYGTGAMGSFVYKLPPVITAVNPPSAGNAIPVTITGANFENGATSVSFGGVPALSVTVVSSTTITAVVGTGASGTLAVTTPYGTASYTGFTWVPAPGISSFTPVSASAGATVTITGTNLNNASSVSFGGAPASSFTVLSNTSIAAVVGLGVSGTVAVTTPGGAASMNGFTYVASPPPVITSFTPATGAVGTPVVITGMNFNPDPARNTVYFGAVKAVVTAASATSLTVTAPAGSSYVPVTVTSNNLTAFASRPFMISFSGSRWFTPNSFKSYTGHIVGPANSSASIATIDLDGDNKADLVINNGSGIIIYKNNSSGGNLLFDAGTRIDPTLFNDCATVGDLDGDGRPDIAYSLSNSPSPDSLIILRNTSSNGIISFSRSHFASQTKVHDLAIKDLDGDGKPEVVGVSYASDRFCVFRNTTQGSAINFASRAEFVTGGEPSGVALEDLDGDGKPDVIVTNAGNEPGRPSVMVHRNTTTGSTISFTSRIDFVAGVSINDVCTGDLDGDGKPDIAVANGNGSTLLRNLSTPGTIALAPRFDLPTNYTLSQGLSIGDLDGDGKADIAVGEYWFVDSVAVFKNISVPGAFSFDSKVNYATGHLPQGVTISDLDGDGQPDISVGSVINVPTEASRVSVLKNQASGEIQLCSGAGYSLAAPVSGSQYQWQVNTGTGFTDLSDNGNYTGTRTATLQLIDIPASWNGYQYRCVVNAINYNPVSIWVKSSVVPTGTAAAPAQACAGNNFDVTFTGTNIPAGTSVQLWESLNGGAFAAGTTKTYTGTPLAYTINSSTSAGTRKYFFRMTPAGSLCGGANNSDTATVTVSQLATPVLTFTGNTITVSNADATAAYSWQVLNTTGVWNDIVPPATGTSYTATVNGTYRVKATKGSCTAFSNGQGMMVTAIDDLVSAGVGNIILFPNPVTDGFTVDSLRLADKWQTLEITGMDGKTRIKTVSISNRTKVFVPAADLKSGMYIITLRRKNGRPVAVKFIKL
ncbi:MAG: FG-GAP-like repeat-containing protein [Chitinophagaceae bacterium]